MLDLFLLYINRWQQPASSKGRKIPSSVEFEPVPASIMWQNGAKISRMSPEKRWQPFWFHLSLHTSLLVLQKVNIDLQPWSKVSDLMQFTASIKASDGRERERLHAQRDTRMKMHGLLWFLLMLLQKLWVWGGRRAGRGMEQDNATQGLFQWKARSPIELTLKGKSTGKQSKWVF